MHAIKLPAHLTDGSRPCFRFDKVDASNTALLIIDLQSVFVDEGQPFASPAARAILPDVEALAKCARSAGASVIFTRASTAKDGPNVRPRWFDQSAAYGPLAPLLENGRPEWEISSALAVEPGDLVIDKYRSSAMLPQSSDLAEILRAKGIDTLIITGAITNYCCENTARDACQMDFRVFFIIDATAALSDEEHNASLGSVGAHADLRTTEEMIRLLG